MELGPNDLLTDNLRLERCLGSGGMGAVWVAKNLSLDSRVAVKLLHRLGAKEAERQRARFEQEAKIVAKLDHPHIVKVFDFGMTGDGDPFIVMELLAGEDLSARIKRIGRFPLPAAVALVEQAASALGKAHARGVVHRDIKPGNIFLLDVPNDPFVKIVDFGLAKLVTTSTSLTRSGEILGTPFYMSPEQFLRPKEVDDRTDLWALGVVTYGILTGRLPFAGDTVVGVSLAVSKGDFLPPSAHDGALPPGIDVFMRRALATDPKGRFQSAAELAAAFREAAASPASSSVAPRPASTPASAAPLALAETRPVARLAPAPAPPYPSPPSSGPVTEVSEPPPRQRIWPWALGSALGAAVVTGGAVFLATRGASTSTTKSASARREPVDMSASSIADLLERATRTAKERDASAELRALSVTEVLASGALTPAGSLSATYAISKRQCLEVEIAAEGVTVHDPTPCGGLNGAGPRCSVPQIRGRIVSKQPVSIVFASLPNGSTWTYSGPDTVGFLPDDCR